MKSFMNKISFFPIFLICLSMVLGIKAFAQEVHGYSSVIANDLSDHNFIVTGHGYLDPKYFNDSTYVYAVDMETLRSYDEEMTRVVITTELDKYRDIIIIEPWTRTESFTASAYRIDDTVLSIFIIENSKDSYGRSQGCTVYIHEWIIPQLKKVKYTTKKKRTSKKRRGKRK